MTVPVATRNRVKVGVSNVVRNRDINASLSLAIFAVVAYGYGG